MQIHLSLLIKKQKKDSLPKWKIVSALFWMTHLHSGARKWHERTWKCGISGATENINTHLTMTKHRVWKHIAWRKQRSLRAPLLLSKFHTFIQLAHTWAGWNDDRKNTLYAAFKSVDEKTKMMMTMAAAAAASSSTSSKPANKSL